VTILRANYEVLLSESKALKEDYLRSLAEFDNFRRRKEREFSELRETASERLLLDLVPILDNFERALQAAETLNTVPGPENNKSGTESIRKGVKMILAQLKEMLAGHGFQEYSCVGEVFDPKRCEAVGYVETDQHVENTIVAETGKGYLYRNRVLRPAMVTVARVKAESLKPEGAIEAASGQGVSDAD
jgi:molecular chaperone GrpE